MARAAGGLAASPRSPESEGERKLDVADPHGAACGRLPRVLEEQDPLDGVGREDRRRDPRS